MPAQFPIIFGVAAIVLIAVIAIASSKKGKDKPATPAPAEKRTDLLFGYFGVLGGQVEQTRDHVNLVWLWDFLDSQSAAVILSRMRMLRRAGLCQLPVRAARRAPATSHRRRSTPDRYVPAPA